MFLSETAKPWSTLGVSKHDPTQTFATEILRRFARGPCYKTSTGPRFHKLAQPGVAA
jgi:hypothetical protein